MYRILLLLIITGPLAMSQALVDGPRLPRPRIQQDDILEAKVSLDDLRHLGMLVFSSPLNKHDGYGDGPMDHTDTITPGGRPTLQQNGTFLRVNGLDGQSCLECHSIISNASVPAKFGVGGVGGSVTNAMFMPSHIDVADDALNGFADFNGRFINPPFLFGSGGVELVGKEMTRELQAIAESAKQQPWRWIPLTTKGVNFGEIMYRNGSFNRSRIRGVDRDLVIRPFGRKGEFPTTRSFDVGAMMFHFGMQPVEEVGKGVDADSDGVVDEILPGEISALAIFNTNLERPVQRADDDNTRRLNVFRQVGCADCHTPELRTESPVLTYSFPEIESNPDANVFFSSDLSESAAGFEKTESGGLLVPLFSDLKRHAMGDQLSESFNPSVDQMFITARLWGVADTAPYMHDGRALTLREAILMHGGEALEVRDAYEASSASDQQAILDLLMTLRTPDHPAEDLLARDTGE